ncbi:hypothetical protein EYZ11_000111 [Aspergillus tanneri]|uniref:Trichothecene 3-O-acetyltransferase-like N-terminal domain-containing protein n=1 Tax=Aspergillus tanneri TaxID=1220188 RepID=A0A4S3JYB3_9EURO|nr:hypothetical protein EYZ11_000111 [Aspergillus tanneri]
MVSMDSLRYTKFPIAMLDVSIIAPINTIPTGTQFPDGAPVFMVQVMSSPIKSSSRAEFPKSTWAYFCFKSNSLAALKSIAKETITIEYVSTEDTLSAFMWESITRTRLPPSDPTSETTFARAIDVRRFLNVPSTYSGLIQNMAYNDSTLQQISDQLLGCIASQLRQEIDPPKIEFRTRALATELHRSRDKSHVSCTATVSPSTSVSFSSWAKVNLC